MIFVDTWAWIGLAVKRDQHHAAVTAEHQKLRQAGRKYVTSNYVISELITYLYKVTPVQAAESFIDALLATAETGDYDLVHLTSAQFRKAWEMRRTYDDKPDISFVDFTSMVVMQEMGITDVFTGDAHFEHVGLGFHLVP